MVCFYRYVPRTAKVTLQDLQEVGEEELKREIGRHPVPISSEIRTKRSIESITQLDKFTPERLDPRRVQAGCAGNTPPRLSGSRLQAPALFSEADPDMPLILHISGTTN
jgi:hypothetical protein